MKKRLIFLSLLLPWFLLFLFPLDFSFYEVIAKPSFAIPFFLYVFTWPILYLLNGVSIYLVMKEYDIHALKDFVEYILVAYFANQCFILFFFVLHQFFAGFIMTVIGLLSAIFLYYETKSLERKAARILLPYLYFSLFTVILQLAIYFLNL